MTRNDIERLLHCARTEGLGAGPNTLAEVCEWALEQERLRRLGDHHHASCSMLAARLVAVEKERDEALVVVALLWEYDPGIGAAAIRALKSKKETP